MIINFLQKDKHRENTFLLIEPHLLYLSDNQSEQYLDLMKNEKYVSGFHNPAVGIIEQYVKSIVGDQKAISFIDLGPGYPDKSLPIARYCQNHNIVFDYYPVDVSAHFLKISSDAMKPWAQYISPVQALFEDCRDKIPAKAYQQQIICNIGLTFMNFEPTKLLPLLKLIAGKQGIVMVASELISDAESIALAIKRYQNADAEKFVFGPLACINIARSDVTYCVRFERHRVEMGYQFIGKPPKLLQEKGVKEDSIIITAVSYRYSQREFSDLLNKWFTHVDLFNSTNGNTAVALCR